MQKGGRLRHWSCTISKWFIENCRKWNDANIKWLLLQHQYGSDDKHNKKN